MILPNRYETFQIIIFTLQPVMHERVKPVTVDAAYHKYNYCFYYQTESITRIQNPKF